MTAPTDDDSEQRLLQRFGRQFGAGEVLFEEGQPATEAYLLQSGRVRLIKHIGATERSLRVVRPGDLFGESALLPGSRRGSTAVALVAGAALSLQHETFQHLLASHPSVGLRVLQQLVRRLGDTEGQIEVLMLRDSQMKVVVALLQLSQEPQISRPDPNGGISVQISPMELSARVGLDVDTVKRNVAQLRNADYLHIIEERIEIHDVDALRELRSLLDDKDRILGGGPPAGPQRSD